jgi:raffinose/stachyose/melibiose transport system substrate-binding protein
MDGQRLLKRSTAAAVGMALTGSLLLVPAASAQDTVIEMWSWNNEGAYPVVHADAEARFEEANPGIDIERRYIPFADYVPLFKTSAAGDAPPCIAQIPWSGDFTDFVGSGELVPLTDSIGTGFPAFFDPIMDIVTVDDDVWAVPLDVNTLQIAYNKTLFEELALAIPETQSDLDAIAAAVAEQGKFGIAMGTKDLWSAGDLFHAQVAYTDGTNTALAEGDAGSRAWDDPVFLAAADNVANMVANGVFAPGANSMDAFVGGLNLFTSGASAMFYPVGNFVTAGVTEAVGDSFEWGLFPFPRPDDVDTDNRATGGIAEMFVITADCANPDEATEFLRYLVDEAGGAALVANDFIPSWDVAVPDDKSALYEDMIDAQSTAHNRTIYTTAVNTALLNAMQGIIDGSSSGQDVVDAMVGAAE